MNSPASGDLFGELLPEPKGTAEGNFAPLAERMRPQSLDEFVGQSHLVGEGRI
ncbi:MAG: recombination factor protein RarA, partial [Acidobacteriota bacterium]|nr:recombination factor protein RarA [Acidobacteriota bacterium]